MAAIELIELKKNYGSVPAVKGVDLAVADGELIVLVGPSGCGKSTLLRMVAGLETISAGEIRIAGRNVTRVEPADRDIAMVFQNYALYPHMSVRQNLEYGLKNRGVPRPEIDSRVAEAASILEIGPLLDRRPGQLSGGQRQRVAMGRAIVRNPAAFLFDEPLSNLDAKLRVQMRVEIRRLQRRLQTTSLYVTHDQMEAMTLADRLVVMNAGEIQQVGTPMEVFSRPETMFVAGFIGSPPMNFIALAGGAAFLAGLPDLPRHTDTVGIRPDAFLLERPDRPVVEIAAVADLVEPVGSESHLHLTVEGLGQTIVASIPSRANIAEGERVTLFVDYTDLHPFNSGTGKRTG